MKGKADTSKKSDAKLKAAGGTAKRKKAAAGGAGRPKRAPSAFFVFLSEFRQQYNEKHPNNKSVASVSKAAGEKWRAMSDAEKEPYQVKAGKKKQEYEKSKAAYDKKESTSSKKAKADEEEEEEPEDEEKSKSEVEDDDEGEEDDEE